VGKGREVGALGSNAQGNHALRPDDNPHLDGMRLLRELMHVIPQKGNATHKRLHKASLMECTMYIQYFDIWLSSERGSDLNLHVQTSNSGDVPLDHLLTCLHLGKQLWISNNSRRVLDLATSLV
jgi:hypothetical protein